MFVIRVREGICKLIIICILPAVRIKINALKKQIVLIRHEFSSTKRSMILFSLSSISFLCFSFSVFCSESFTFTFLVLGDNVDVPWKKYVSVSFDICNSSVSSLGVFKITVLCKMKSAGDPTIDEIDLQVSEITSSVSWSALVNKILHFALNKRQLLLYWITLT